LLEKAGILKLGRAKADGLKVEFTPAGERKLESIPGVAKTRNSDSTEGYTVPLAQRELVAISKITMGGRDLAYVQFTWRWVPNDLGNAFDAAGPLVKSFNTWDRSTLIDKYGVAFYHVEPAQASLTFVRRDKAWKLAAQ
jgi:hypothetical protein